MEHNNDKIKVCIMGGGIGGLSAAHQLAKYPDVFHVDLYERNSELGGLARSALNDDKKHTEYAWHAIGVGYTYFLNILNEIIDPEGVKLISRLRPIEKIIYATNNNCYHENNISFLTDPNIFEKGFKNLYGHEMSISEKIKFYGLLFKAKYACDDRIKSCDKDKWVEELSNVSDDLYQIVVYFTTLYLGMDPNDVNKHTILELLRDKDYFCELIENKQYNFYCLDGPINKVFFKNWERLLTKKGVNIYTETEILSLSCQNNANANRITGLSLNTKYHKDIEIEYDIFINGLDIQSLSELYPSPVCSLQVQKEQFETLARNSYQIQTQILYYLDYKLKCPESKPSILLLPDTPWMIMVKIEGEFWGTDNCDYLSAAIGCWDSPGIKIMKDAKNCTEVELAEECWFQINNTQHNLKLSQETPDWDLWKSYKYDDDKSEIDTYEPKFSNNINTLMYRPHIADSCFNNLYHATAYTQTRANVFNMESAAEAGTNASNFIIYGILGINLFTEERRSRSLLQKIYQWIDKNIFYPICN